MTKDSYYSIAIYKTTGSVKLGNPGDGFPTHNSHLPHASLLSASAEERPHEAEEDAYLSLKNSPTYLAKRQRQPLTLAHQDCFS